MGEYKYLRLKNYLNVADIPLCAYVSKFELYVVEAAKAVGWGRCDRLIGKFDVERSPSH